MVIIGVINALYSKYQCKNPCLSESDYSVPIPTWLPMLERNMEALSTYKIKVSTIFAKL